LPPAAVDPPLLTVDPPLPGVDPPLPTPDPPLPGVDPPLPGVDPPLPGVDPPLPGVDPPLPGVDPPLPADAPPAPAAVTSCLPSDPEQAMTRTGAATTKSNNAGDIGLMCISPGTSGLLAPMTVRGTPHGSSPKIR
jgi:hypothetical protein